MRSNYKNIGSFVKRINIRNRDLSVTNLQGISIDKYFMPSVANILGTDLTKYKVVAPRQFAFNPMHVGRDEVLPISMLDTDEKIIVSPAYTVFMIKDENKLLPDYLMMWCRRPEFDRNVWFTTDSSVRGGFKWEDFCDLRLPVPYIEKQRQIVQEYQTVTDRIKLNEELNKKLEEAAQAIYKQWFVDFEFPMTKKDALKMGNPELEGKPYKSSGGPMVWNDELDQEIPEGWESTKLAKIMTFQNGRSRPETKGVYPVYGGNGVLSFTDYYNDKNTIVIGRVGANCGSLYRVAERCWVSDNAISAKSKKGTFLFDYFVLKSLSLNKRSEGTGQPLLTQNILGKLQICNPPGSLSTKFEKTVSPLDHLGSIINKEVKQLKKVSEILLSKMATEGVEV